MCEAMFETNPDIPVDVYLDNNRSKSGMEYRGKQIVHPEDYPNLKELYIVVVIALVLVVSGIGFGIWFARSKAN